MTGSASGALRFLARPAAGIGGLGGWRRAAIGFAAGALGAAALPPVYALPVLLVSFPVLVWLIDSAPTFRRAFFDGWWFGFGYFVAGLYWIGFSLLVEAERFAWLLPFTVLCIPAVLAIYTACVAALARRAPAGAARIVALAAAWTLFEWLRGRLFTGFPWNALGTVWSASDETLQFAALAGMYGLSFLTVLVAAAPSLLAPGDDARSYASRAALVAGALLIVPALWAGGAWRLSGATQQTVPDVMLRIVQPNIAQRDKWHPDLRERHLATYLRLSSSPAERPPTHLIWPETAVPFVVNTDPERRRIMASVVPPGGLLLTGAIRTTLPGEHPFRVWNSLHAIDGEANIVADYDKFHLVPFGEYIPLRRWLGFAKVTAGRTDFSAGPGPRTLHLPGLPPVSPLICYEVIFPAKVTAPGPRPAWLLNVTNDAWFGTSTGPYQHFAAARLRAVEQGLPLVRAANTGISGVIDGYGRVLARLGLNRQGVIDAALPRQLEEPTPYARWGNYPILVIAASLLLATAIAFRRSRSEGPRV